MRKSFLLGLVWLLLSGCVFAPQIKTSNDVFLRSRVDIDPYKKTTWIVSPSFEKSHPGVNYSSVFLRALVKDKKIVFYQFYISDKNPDWKFYSSAYDLTGKRLDFIEIDTQVTSIAWCQEVFGILLDRKYLNEAVTTGLNIKAGGKKGDRIFILPSYYIEGFLKKVDEYIEGKPEIGDIIRNN